MWFSISQMTHTEHYAADVDKQRRVLNITDDAMAYHLTQLDLYDSGKSYQVQW